MAKIRKVPRKYTSGLSKSTTAKRKAEIRKRATGKKESFKPLPGDAKAKTKTSQHTKKATRTGLRKKILEQATKEKGSQRDRFITATAKVTKIPRRIIRQVFERGEKAWSVGHRPGASQSSWAIARVYSFLTGGKTTTTGDADLFREVKNLRRKS
tara:strand:+ start:796 stop:1260 length:465 start_codon:yes stop_codon:yes gene_type:complete